MKTSYSDKTTQTYKTPWYKTRAAAKKNTKKTNPSDTALELREVFPQNHQTNCLFHIRQNVVSKSDIQAGELVDLVGRTFSTQQE